MMNQEFDSAAVVLDFPRPLSEPIFIVAAPRSGSTLLFETLAQSNQFATVGGEAHWLADSIPALQPGRNRTDSNQLGAQHASPVVVRHMVSSIMARLVDHRGRRVGEHSPMIFLEKTPKHALRIPFFRKAFPNAKFLFLWRDPRENISSIMEAWRSGRYVTYRSIKDFSGSWSLVLPPGFKALNDKPLQEIAAFQWRMTNQIAIDDLEGLPRSRWSVLSYARFLSDPTAAIHQICEWAGLEADPGLMTRASGALPVSRSTQTKPTPDKWRMNELEILKILPEVEPLWKRLESLTGA